MSDIKPQHTPGPWMVHGATLVFGREGNVCECGEPRAEKFVSHTKAGISSPDFDEACANARLIAAAPRMYEVIKRGAMAGDAECLSIMAAIDGCDE